MERVDYWDSQMVAASMEFVLDAATDGKPESMVIGSMNLHFGCAHAVVNVALAQQADWS